MMTFTFNGENSRTFGLFIEEFPQETGGQKILQSVQVAGRTGALTIDTGAIQNVTKTYAVAFRGDTQRMRDVRQWLALSSGYCRLEDDYDPDVYRLARIIKLPDFENVRNKYGRGTIQFDCDPRRFLKEGERAVTGPVENHWMPSRPIIKITANGPGGVSVGSYAITITTDPTMDIYIDSEMREVHNGTTSLASVVSMTEFPILEHGVNNVASTGAVTAVEIIPNYWQP